MAQSGKTAKIAAGATVRRLKKQARTAGIVAAFFPAVCLAGIFFLSGPGRIAFAAGTAAAIIVCLIFCGKFAASARRIVKEAEKYSFALTEAFFFECFGPFLALNVSFRDDRGTLREGRTRFLFGIRDLEAWQNIPLEIAYRGADERVILIGGVLAFLYTPDLFLEADFSACFAVLSTSSILSGNRFLVICWSVKLKVMTTLSLYKITSRIKFLTINFLAPLLSISPHTAF